MVLPLYFLLLLPPAAVIPANPAFSPLFVPSPKLQHRAVMLSVTEIVAWKSLVRAEERLCLSVWKGERRLGRQTFKRIFRNLEYEVQKVQSHSVQKWHQSWETEKLLNGED